MPHGVNETFLVLPYVVTGEGGVLWNIYRPGEVDWLCQARCTWWREMFRVGNHREACMHPPI